MKALESWTLAYVLNSLWQVPLVFMAAWVAARAARRSIATAHKIWVSALVLEAVLPACTFRPIELLFAFWQFVSLFGRGAVDGAVRVTIGPATIEHGIRQLPAMLLAGVAIVYGCSVVYFGGRLGWGLWKISALRRRAECIAARDETGVLWARCRELFDVQDAEAAVSGDISGAMTIGVFRRMLLLPTAWQASLTGEDLEAAIAHECVHIQRRDFAKNLAYEMLSLPIAYHPLLWLTRARLTESREMICDELAADAVAGREKYARSLLRLASLFSEGTPARALHAIGIFDANIFERRVMNLTEKRMELQGARRMMTAIVCVVLGVGTCASALTLRMEVPTTQSESQPVRSSSALLKVRSEVMAGNILNRVDPVYPADAKAAGVSGAVVLHALISANGTIERLEAVSGPEPLKRAALDAVRFWTYKPYLLNGNPMEVDTSITVNFSLQQ